MKRASRSSSARSRSKRTRFLSQFLKAEGIPHELLNAKNHEREGEIIAQAGRVKGVTIATNMAGRGVDIKLGGNPGTPEAYEKVKGIERPFRPRHRAPRGAPHRQPAPRPLRPPGRSRARRSFSSRSRIRSCASLPATRSSGLMGTLGMPEDEPIENRIISALSRPRRRKSKASISTRASTSSNMTTF